MKQSFKNYIVIKPIDLFIEVSSKSHNFYIQINNELYVSIYSYF